LKASGTPLKGISKESFALPHLSNYLFSIHNELLNWRGFIQFKSLPVQEWGNHAAIAYMGLEPYLVYFVSQNGKGHLLDPVKDLWEDARPIDKFRILRTSARQYSHTDPAELISLRCVLPARLRGESDILLKSSGV